MAYDRNVTTNTSCSSEGSS
nr:hypothetical protein [Streptomyces clavuligerus]